MHGQKNIKKVPGKLAASIFRVVRKPRTAILKLKISHINTFKNSLLYQNYSYTDLRQSKLRIILPEQRALLHETGEVIVLWDWSTWRVLALKDNTDNAKIYSWFDQYLNPPQWQCNLFPPMGGRNKKVTFGMNQV